ncbi:unnamed protein product, partial [Discosporangium mesarthrocarpum]
GAHCSWKSVFTSSSWPAIVFPVLLEASGWCPLPCCRSARGKSSGGTLSVCICLYVYVCICLCVYVYLFAGKTLHHVLALGMDRADMYASLVLASFRVRVRVRVTRQGVCVGDGMGSHTSTIL